MACGHAGKNCARLRDSAEHRLSSRHHAQAAGGGDAESVHRFANDVFTQHWSQCGASVTTAGKGRWAGAFELNVKTFGGGCYLLAE